MAQSPGRRVAAAAAPHLRPADDGTGMARQTSDLTVFITARESACDECGEELGRHAETKYDTLLARGYDRRDARSEIAEAVQRVLARWAERS